MQPATNFRVLSAAMRNSARQPAEICVQRLVGPIDPRGIPTERRRDQRYPYPRLVEIRPVDAAGQPTADVIVVAGRHVSQRGFDFFHPEPMPYRLVVATFDCGDSGRLQMLLDVSWCRFNRRGWYESGGRFLRVLDSGEHATDEVADSDHRDHRARQNEIAIDLKDFAASEHPQSELCVTEMNSISGIACEPDPMASG